MAAFTGNGSCAEIALAQALCTFPLNETGETVVLMTAAGFPTIVLTAYDLLVRIARLQKGEAVTTPHV